MTFEEAKKLLLESVDEVRNLNDLLHTVVNKIYLKGYEDGVRVEQASEKIKEFHAERNKPENIRVGDEVTAENGQRILVSVKYRRDEAVQMDEYYDDDGCYLDSGYEIGTEVTHWMPLPEPPKEEK